MKNTNIIRNTIVAGESLSLVGRRSPGLQEKWISGLHGIWVQRLLNGLLMGLVMLLPAMELTGQVPTRFNQQAVVRDTTGQVVANRSLRLRISLEQTVGGAAVLRYREVHQVTTNANGLYTVEVGGGAVELGRMDSVRWDLGSVYLKSEVDPSGGQNYQLHSIRELLSVPYALHSLNTSKMPPGVIRGQMNYWNGQAWVSITPGTTGQVLTFCHGVPSWNPCSMFPVLTTTAVTGITVSGALTGGNVTSDGGASVTARGVAYGTAASPTISGTITNNGTGTGSFTSQLIGLTGSTLYYVRAYATNAVGTAYGSELTFTTTVAAPSFTCGTSTVTDVDGNTYNTVLIGTQCWTQSNLKVSKYRNGNAIPTGLSNTAWETTTAGAYAVYNNALVNDTLYGKLYNHYAVTDSRGLCPTGWHVPTDSEWNRLVKHLDANADTICVTCYQSGVAGGALKSTATQPTRGGWNSPNTGATNSSGFTAGPSGLRLYNGNFYNLGTNGYWWSSSSSGSFAWYRYLYYDYGVIYRYHNNRAYGFSVRCLRD